MALQLRPPGHASLGEGLLRWCLAEARADERDGALRTRRDGGLWMLAAAEASTEG
jgi:hypothetical protein